MKKFIFFIALWTGSTSAICQTVPVAPIQDETQTPPSAKPSWSGKFTIAAGFNAARLPKGADQQTVDESEHEISLEVVRSNFIKRGWFLRFLGGATYAPQAFDDEDPSSAKYVQIALGDDWIDIRTPTALDGLLWNGQVKPFLRFRHADAQKELLDGHVRYDDTLTVGTVLRSNLPEQCKSAGAIRGLCKSGWRLSAGGDLERNWSSDPTKRYWQAKLTGKLETPALQLGAKFSLFTSFEGSRRVFDEIETPESPRRDWVGKASGAMQGELEVSGVDFTLQAGLRYQIRESNIEEFDHNRTYGFGSIEASLDF